MNWQQLQQFIEQHHLSDKTLVVALSGGADSVALLYLFYQLRQQTSQAFSAIHVHHGLSINADSWQNQVEQLCQRLQVSLTVQKVVVEKRNRQSLEQQARQARYQIIESTLLENSALFTGHHQIDQFETFILRLMRSSGLTGLTAMKPVSSYPMATEKKLCIARPLLSQNKQQLLQFLAQHKLSWLEDESNNDQTFDRNFVRNSLFPVFLKRWQSASQSVAASVELLQQEAQLLDEYIAADHQRCITRGFIGDNTLDLKQLNTFSSNKQSVLVRRFIQQSANEYPSRNALEQILRQGHSAAKDSQPQIKVGEYWARIHKAKLHLVNKEFNQACKLASITNPSFNVAICLPKPCIYSKLTINSNVEMSGQWSIQWQRNDAKLTPQQGSGSKKVKQLLKQAGCPPWLRDKVPLLFVDDCLVAVADLYLDIKWRDTLSISVQ